MSGIIITFSLLIPQTKQVFGTDICPVESDVRDAENVGVKERGVAQHVWLLNGYSVPRLT